MPGLADQGVRPENTSSHFLVYESAQSLVADADEALNVSRVVADHLIPQLALVTS